MSTAVLYHEPACQESVPVQVLASGEQQRLWPAVQSALTARRLAARAAALFVSDLSARCEYTQIEVAAAIRRAIGTHDGVRGCAGAVAAAYGEYPETAARRMRWARAVVEGINASAGWPGGPE